jgi:D-isomer specific 2-hydroxyacid dehydrogenase, catalytic domain
LRVQGIEILLLSLSLYETRKEVARYDVRQGVCVGVFVKDLLNPTITISVSVSIRFDFESPFAVIDPRAKSLSLGLTSRDPFLHRIFAAFSNSPCAPYLALLKAQVNMDSPGSETPIVCPRVLVPEKLSPDGFALLRTTLDVEKKKGLSPDDLEGIIGRYDALLIRSETKVTEQLLKAAKNLKVVARAGVGVDNVDVKAGTQLGIIVVNSPSGNIGAAAEHTIAFLVALARNVPDACASVKDNKWERSRHVGVEVKGNISPLITPSAETPAIYSATEL